MAQVEPVQALSSLTSAHPDPAARAAAAQTVIHADNLGKAYRTYDRPQDRLLQPFVRRQLYREFWPLRGVTFDVEAGETVGIMGRNGAGKSTLLQIIAGTLAPSVGHVAVRGRVSALLELGSGFNLEFSGRENAYLYASILGLSRQYMDARFDAIASFADVGRFMDQPLKTYSSGMVARVAFAVAMSVEPDILIVDEVLAVGDAPFQAKCLKRFHELRDGGCAVLLVSHDAYTIRSFCRRALYLRQGELVAFGDSTMVADLYEQEVQSALARDGGWAWSEEAQPEPPPSGGGGTLFAIDDVGLLDHEGRPCTVVPSGAAVRLRFRYSTREPFADRVVFVFNLYRHDGLYVCGTTTLMDGMPALRPGRSGVVEVTFPRLPLLAGSYVWRVAIDDDRGLGVLAQANRVCGFEVRDDLEAVGLVDIERRWRIESDGGDGTP
jgi:ABC-type polysaccharide/polyol phosphate transport system ATPase subunit